MQNFFYLTGFETCYCKRNRGKYSNVIGVFLFLYLLCYCSTPIIVSWMRLRSLSTLSTRTMTC